MMFSEAFFLNVLKDRHCSSSEKDQVTNIFLLFKHCSESFSRTVSLVHKNPHKLTTTEFCSGPTKKRTCADGT